MATFVEWGALGRVVALSLVVGAGLPALFAVGVRLLAHADAARGHDGRRAWSIAGAVAAFGAVLAAVISALVALAGSGR